MVGLQGAHNKTLRYAKDLIDDGFIGRMTSASLAMHLDGHGPVVPDQYGYVADASNHATLLTIAAAQALFAMRSVVGEFATVSGVVGPQYDSVRLVPSGRMVPNDAPNQVVLAGVLDNGAHASAHLSGGASRLGGNCLTICGTEGDLLIRSRGGANLHRADLALWGGRGEALEPMPIPDRYLMGSPSDLSLEMAAGVAGMYQQLAEALRSGGGVETDFAFAVRWQRFLEEVNRSSDLGVRVEPFADVSKD